MHEGQYRAVAKEQLPSFVLASIEYHIRQHAR